MDWLSHLDTTWLVIFALVLLRISGVVMVGTPLADVTIPMRAKALLIVALALLVTPMQREVVTQLPEGVGAFFLVAGGELLVGLALGVGMLILFAGIQLAGALVGTISGMALSEVFNPGINDSVPLFSQLYYLIAVAVFLIVGGQRYVIGGLLDTFATIPPGQGAIAETTLETITRLLQMSFGLGIRVAAPTVLALLLATLVMGLISRTLPQLNILMFGFGFNAFILLGMLAVTLGSTAWLLEDQIGVWVQTMLDEIPVAGRLW